MTVSIEKKFTTIDKNGEKITENISYTLQFIDSARRLKTHYQILSIIFLKEFIKLNENCNTMITYVKPVELNISILKVFL